MATHRNPLMAAPIHIFCGDELHIMHLGVYKRYVSRAFWHTLLGDVFRVGDVPAPVRVEMGVARLREELFTWYKERRRLAPDCAVYATNDLTVKMFGAPPHGQVSSKAAETGTLVQFVVFALERHRERLANADVLIDAGRALLSYHNITRSSQTRLEPRQHQELTLG